MRLRMKATEISLKDRGGDAVKALLQQVSPGLMQDSFSRLSTIAG